MTEQYELEGNAKQVATNLAGSIPQDVGCFVLFFQRGRLTEDSAAAFGKVNCSHEQLKEVLKSFLRRRGEGSLIEVPEAY